MITTDNLYVRFEYGIIIITVVPIEGTLGKFTQVTLIDSRSSQIYVVKTKAPPIMRILNDCNFQYTEDDMTHGRTLLISPSVCDKLVTWIRKNSNNNT